MMRKVLFGAATLVVTLLASCGGGGDEPFTPPPGNGGGTPQLPSPASAPALKTVMAAKFGVVNFPVGAAIEPASTTNADSAVLLKHFSSITAENAMKPDALWPSMPGTSLPMPTPDFTQADILAAFAFNNNIRLRGHTLLWHRTIPAWMLDGPVGDPVNYRVKLQQNLRNYIFAVVQHFPNVYAWDVVNEVASDTPNAANPYRTDSLWYAAYASGGGNGADYVRDAFNLANEARISIGKNSSNMKLMLNDYNTELPGKRANVMQIVQQLVTAGVPIDGVGHQFHLQLGWKPFRPRWSIT
jgi:endo-1,4-beta-xylanase